MPLKVIQRQNACAPWQNASASDTCWQNAFTLYGPLYLTTRVLELTQMQYWDLLLAGKMPLYGDTLSWDQRCQLHSMLNTCSVTLLGNISAYHDSFSHNISSDFANTVATGQKESIEAVWLLYYWYNSYYYCYQYWLLLTLLAAAETYTTSAYYLKPDSDGSYCTY